MGFRTAYRKGTQGLDVPASDPTATRIASRDERDVAAALTRGKRRAFWYAIWVVPRMLTGLRP